MNMHEPPNTSPPEVDRFSAGVVRGGGVVEEWRGGGGRGEAVWQVLPAPLSACVSITFRGMKKGGRVVAAPARW